jgi:hypothetical protein
VKQVAPRPIPTSKRSVISMEVLCFPGIFRAIFDKSAEIYRCHRNGLFGSVGTSGAVAISSRRVFISSSGTQLLEGVEEFAVAKGALSG